nr:hypothetical protein [Kibdelosporangium sp. MJ126-NF4]CEL21597.1 hypothetical protein [Kibdelosporangium sp. MJ126-NF4]CTQ92378.1 hypothetical protein [Kibdelosporangium sp. MJ126-NF4]
MNRLFLVAALLLVSLSACAGENKIAPEDSQRLADQIRSELPQARSVSVKAWGDGYSHPETIDISIDSGLVDDVGAVRAQMRKAAKLAWLHGKARASVIAVTLNEVTRSDGGCVAGECGYTRIELPGDAATRLWGTTDAGERSSAAHGKTFTVTTAKDGKPGEVSRGWTVKPDIMFRPVTEISVTADGRNEEELRPGSDAIAAVYWREHPDRIKTLELTFAREVPGAAPQLVVTIRYTAEQLQAKFGPRAADLTG